MLWIVRFVRYLPLAISIGQHIVSLLDDVKDAKNMRDDLKAAKKEGSKIKYEVTKADKSVAT